MQKTEYKQKWLLGVTMQYVSRKLFLVIMHMSLSQKIGLHNLKDWDEFKNVNGEKKIKKYVQLLQNVYCNTDKHLINTCTKILTSLGYVYDIMYSVQGRFDFDKIPQKDCACLTGLRQK